MSEWYFYAARAGPNGYLGLLMVLRAMLVKEATVFRSIHKHPSTS